MLAAGAELGCAQQTVTYRKGDPVAAPPPEQRVATETRPHLGCPGTLLTHARIKGPSRQDVCTRSVPANCWSSSGGAASDVFVTMDVAGDDPSVFEQMKAHLDERRCEAVFRSPSPKVALVVFDGEAWLAYSGPLPPGADVETLKLAPVSPRSSLVLCFKGALPPGTAPQRVHLCTAPPSGG